MSGGGNAVEWDAVLQRYMAQHGLKSTRQRSLIIEFENDRIEALQEAVARRHGFHVTSHKMELYGLCRDCQRASARAAQG